MGTLGSILRTISAYGKLLDCACYALLGAHLTVLLCEPQNVGVGSLGETPGTCDEIESTFPELPAQSGWTSEVVAQLDCANHQP